MRQSSKKNLETTFLPTLYGLGKMREFSLVKIARRARQRITFDERYLNPDFKPNWSETPFKEIKNLHVTEKLHENNLKILLKD